MGVVSLAVVLKSQDLQVKVQQLKMALTYDLHLTNRCWYY